jgi:hypothetical protein
MPASAAAPLAAALLAVSWAGCGTASAPPAPPLGAEQQAVARANAICSEYLGFARAWQARVGLRPGRAAIARLLVVKRSAARRRQGALTAVAARPEVRAYLNDLAARERALREVRRALAGSGATNAVPRPALDRLRAKVAVTYAAATALGLSGCVGAPPPRQAGG